MQWSSVFKVIGFILLLALAVITYFYQRVEERNLLILFGLYAMTGLFGAFYFFKVMIPAIGDSLTTAMMESGEEPEEPPMVRIRALTAAGEYETAVQELKLVAAVNPADKTPWTELALLQQKRLGDLDGAVATLEQALVSNDWEEEDGGFFHFRLVDLHEQRNDLQSAIAVLDRVIETYPNTRHSGNANHKKRELEKVLRST
jgi:tetratricopeptide (TPR) repeat protein